MESGGGPLAGKAGAAGVSVRDPDGQQHRDEHAQAGDGPGHGAVLRVHFHDEQAGDGKHERGDGKEVDEPAPGRAHMTALVQVVEPGNPAAVGEFIFNIAGFQVQPQPGVAAGAQQRDIDLE